MKEKIALRKATHSDYEGVVEMSKGIYNGHDYFPCVFHEWVQAENRVVLVALVEEKLVGLRAVHIVDDGRTMISQGLRVHPKWRGNGISSMLIKGVHDHVRKNFPDVTKERFTTKSDNVERLAIQKKYGDDFVLEQEILAYYADIDIYQSSRAQNMQEEYPKLWRYSKDECAPLLFKEEVKQLFKSETLIIDWQPYLALPSNLNDLIHPNDLLLAETSPKDLGRGKVVKSLSHGRASPRVTHMHWVVTVYTDDPLLYKAHLLAHLKHASMQLRQEFIFSPFQHKDLTQSGRELLGKDLALKYEDFFDFNLVLFEKDFD